MKIRILSDLHLDINKRQPLTFNKSKIFTVICGDISGNIKQTLKWIKSNVKQGVFVEGNHIGYDSKHSIQYIEKVLCQQYPTTAPITYLKNNYKIVDDVVFVGGILWTDFCLFGKDMQTLYKIFATQMINDYRYNNTNNKHLKKETELNFEELVIKKWIRKLTASDTVDMFNATLCNIEQVCQRFPDKKIVVVTHHAPSEKSVPEMYLTDKTTPAFASNLEQFILDHPNIKLWCHGHSHTACDYQIGNCRIICNPRGYVSLGENTGFNKKFCVEV